MNKVCIPIINCHSGNTFKIEGIWFCNQVFLEYLGTCVCVGVAIVPKWTSLDENKDKSVYWVY